MKRLLPLSPMAVVGLVLGIAVLPLVFRDNNYQIFILTLIGLFTMLTVGLSLVMGYAGQVSLGHATFYGAGAYLTALFSTLFALPPWAALVAATALTVLLGFLIGVPIFRLRGHYLAMATLGLSHVPERRQVFGSLTVMENLILGAYCRARRDGRAAIRRDADYVFSLFPALEARNRQLAGTLSGGEQQMLAVGRGLMARPKLMLLDEPSLGLAPLIVQEIFQILAELRRGGTTILLVEQNARAALRVSDRGYVLENGRVVMRGAAGELAEDERLQRAYLGRRDHWRRKQSGDSDKVTG